MHLAIVSGGIFLEDGRPSFTLMPVFINSENLLCEELIIKVNERADG